MKLHPFGIHALLHSAIVCQGIQFYCPSHTFPAIPLLQLFFNFYPSAAGGLNYAVTRFISEILSLQRHHTQIQSNFL